MPSMLIDDMNYIEVKANNNTILIRIYHLYETSGFGDAVRERDVN
jgi:acyl-CoA-binding protein